MSDCGYGSTYRTTYLQHGDCDYNGGPGSDQCPHGVFFVESQGTDVVSDDPPPITPSREDGGA